jgi:uncharacterized protein DUF3617
MRTAAAFLFAGLALPALAAEQLPDFRPGLWEFKRSVDSGDGKPATLTNQKCTSPTDDMNRKTQSMATSGCQASPVTRSGNIYSFSFKCTLQGVPVESKSVITFENESAYKVDVQSKQGTRTSREQLDARRVGDCKVE